MLHTIELNKHKNKLEKSYHKLINRYNDYRYIDESISDMAYYKALKVIEQLNRIKYLENSML